MIPLWVKEFLYSATDEELMMSVKNCHGKNITSIVLQKRPDGSLLRMFLAEEGHPLTYNLLPHDLAVGVHSHRYDIDLSLVCGNVYNSKYTETAWGGLQINKWSFRSGVESGKPEVRSLGKSGLILSQITKLEPCNILSTSSALSMSSVELHTMHVIGEAAWVVEEGILRSDVTELFTTADKIELGGMYDRFDNPEQVRKHVLDFLERQK